MKKLIWSSCALALLVLVVWTPAAVAADASHGPEAIAKACIEFSQRTASHAIAHNHVEADRTVVKVKALLKAGKVEAAKQAAEKGIERITERSDNHVERIKQRCDRTVDVLLELGAPGLAKRVGTECAKDVVSIRQSQARAVVRIKNAVTPETE